MIAIMMATYNGEKYIAEQLDSILNQTYEDIVCYIHDDGSTDGTLDIIKKYADDYPNKVCIVEGGPTGGSKNNFLYLLKNVEADYYMYSDQDDVWLPHKISTLKAHLEEIEKELGDKAAETPIMVFGDMKVVDENLDVINDSFIKYNNLDTENLTFNRLVVQNVVAGCTTLFNRKLRDEGLKFKDQDKLRWHDWWLALIASGKGRIAFHNESLQLYRQHNDNSIGAEQEIGLKKKLKLLYWLVTLSHVSTTKYMISNFVNQAAELDVIKLTGDNRKIVRVMKEFYSMNKIQRIRCFRRYDIRRNKRNIWMLICL
jgi:Glycosyltransferases involved in cell wall biogenesis